jgi:hypothetical protein
MDMLWVYEVPLWVDAAVLAIVLLVALESGFRLGLRRQREGEGAEKVVRGDVTLGSMLALLGLMLAFTYAFSLSRADMRKQAVITEANAIGTAFLRADLAAEPGRSQLRQQLLAYARTRVVTAEQAQNRKQLQQVIARSLEAQAKLWPATRLALKGEIPAPLQASLVQAVNEVLDANTTRLAVVFDRLPGVVLVLLVLVAAASLGVAGHTAGLRGRMNRWRMSAFALVLAALMFIIVDFDSPLRGFIQVSHESLVAVIRDMEAALGDQ